MTETASQHTVGDSSRPPKSPEGGMVRWSLIAALVALGTAVAWGALMGGSTLFADGRYALGVGWLTVFPALALFGASYLLSLALGVSVVFKRPVVLWWLVPLVSPPLGLVFWVIIWNVRRAAG